MNSTCGTKMSGNENMSFSANAYSLQMIEFSYSCSVKKTVLKGRNESFVCERIKLKKQCSYLNQKRLQCPQSTADQQSLMSAGL